MPYIDFLQYCLDDHKELPVSANTIDWNYFLVWAEQQSIAGIILEGIQKTDKEALNIPLGVLMKWIGYVNQIENRNRQLNIRCAEIVDHFKAKGFESCILKGQGNALLYPNPYSRTPGDIDLWLRSERKCPPDKDMKDIIRSVKRDNPHGRTIYHHIDYGNFKGVDADGTGTGQ